MREPAVVAVVLTLLAGCSLGEPRETNPAEPPVTSPAALSERVVGNWRMVHRVDPLPGWRVIGREVHGFAESTTLAATGNGDDTCSTEVWGPRNEPREREPGQADIVVNGRAGYVSTGGASGQPALHWEYRDDAWAQMSCSADDDFATARAMAERTVFQPTSLRVPLRLRWVPEDYLVSAVDESSYRGRIGGLWRLSPRSAGDETPDITITAGEGESNLPRASEGIERDTVAGYPPCCSPARGPSRSTPVST